MTTQPSLLDRADGFLFPVEPDAPSHAGNNVAKFPRLFVCLAFTFSIADLVAIIRFNAGSLEWIDAAFLLLAILVNAGLVVFGVRGLRDLILHVLSFSFSPNAFPDPADEQHDDPEQEAPGRLVLKWAAKTTFLTMPSIVLSIYLSISAVVTATTSIAFRLCYGSARTAEDLVDYFFSFFLVNVVPSAASGPAVAIARPWFVVPGVLPKIIAGAALLFAVPILLKVGEFTLKIPHR